MSKIFEEEVPDIEPDFLDYESDIKQADIGVPLLYMQTKKIADLNYSISAIEVKSQQKLSMAIDYFNFLGTEDMSPAKKKEQFYKLGCELL